MAEVYAGLRLSYTDHEIGRLLDYLRGDRASSTTPSSCSSPTTAPAARAARTARSTRTSSSTACPDTIEENLKYLDELGSPNTYNHYPTGLGVGVQHALQDVEALQLRGRHRRPVDHLLAEGDQGQGRDAAPVLPCHRHRADDLRLLGVELPEEVKGYTQIPLEGVSLRHTFDDAKAPTQKETAFFTMLGSRAIWHKGWKAVTVHPTIDGWGNFAQDRWELLQHGRRPCEMHDLAANIRTSCRR